MNGFSPSFLAEPGQSLQKWVNPCKWGRFLASEIMLAFGLGVPDDAGMPEERLSLLEQAKVLIPDLSALTPDQFAWVERLVKTMALPVNSVRNPQSNVFP